jgi:glycosyltransferase involved in cell wall biosynthesis
MDMPPQSPLRILFVSHLGDLKGGADKMLLRLLLGLDRNKITPLVLVPYRESQLLVAALQEADIPYMRAHYRSWINYHHRFPRKLYRLFSNLVTAFILGLKLRRRVDVVYTNTLYSPLGALLALTLQVPHLWHVHEFIEEDMGGSYDWGRSLSMRLVYSISSKVLCNSQAIQQKMAQSISPEKLQVIYNGIFEEPISTELCARAQPLHTEKPYQISIVGRLHKAKGQEEAIRAIHHLLQQNFDVQLHIVGEGTPLNTEALKQLVKDLNISQHVIWHGFIDPFTLYKQVDVNLVCSRSEAFGMVVIEPMSVGCPVIGANAGAIPELIGAEERGLTYTPGDHVMLAQKIKRLLTDSQLYQRISTLACAFASQNFMVRRYVEEIEEVLLNMRSDQ